MTYTVTITRDDTMELITMTEDHLPHAIRLASFAMEEEHTTSVAVRNDDAAQTCRFWWALWDTEGVYPC